MPWLDHAAYSKQFETVKLTYDTKLLTQPQIFGYYKGSISRQNVFGKLYYIHRVLTPQKQMFLVMCGQEEKLFEYVQLNQLVRVTPTYYSFEIEVFDA